MTRKTKSARRIESTQQQDLFWRKVASDKEGWLKHSSLGRRRRRHLNDPTGRRRRILAMELEGGVCGMLRERERDEYQEITKNHTRAAMQVPVGTLQGRFPRQLLFLSLACSLHLDIERRARLFQSSVSGPGPDIVGPLWVRIWTQIRRALPSAENGWLAAGRRSLFQCCDREVLPAKPSILRRLQLNRSC